MSWQSQRKTCQDEENAPVKKIRAGAMKNRADQEKKNEKNKKKKKCSVELRCAALCCAVLRCAACRDGASSSNVNETVWLLKRRRGRRPKMK
jgi:hypothetical protein